MKKTYKYRLLGIKQTITKAVEWLLLCQRLYNVALEQRISVYRQNKSSISCCSQINQLPELMTSLPEYKEVGSQVLQDVVERWDKAYKAFFRRVKNASDKPGFPRFRSRERYNSFTLKQKGWKLNGKYLSIRNVGRFKLRLSRPIEGNIKTVTNRRKIGKWYVCFSCDKVPECKLEASNKTSGLDAGIKSFCVDSDGGSSDSPMYLRKSERLLRVRQMVLSKRVKGSHSRRETRPLVAKAHEKVTNQQNDFLHKAASYYITNYGVLCVEYLNLKVRSRIITLPSQSMMQVGGNSLNCCHTQRERLVVQ